MNVSHLLNTHHTSTVEARFVELLLYTHKVVQTAFQLDRLRDEKRELSQLKMLYVHIHDDY